MLNSHPLTTEHPWCADFLYQGGIREAPCRFCCRNPEAGSSGLVTISMVLLIKIMARLSSSALGSLRSCSYSPQAHGKCSMYLDATTTHLPVSCMDILQYFLCWINETVILAWELPPFHVKPSSMSDRPEMETRAMQWLPRNTLPFLTEDLNTEGEDYVFRNLGL